MKALKEEIIIDRSVASFSKFLQTLIKKKNMHLYFKGAIKE